nr:tetratricopeptide repeat protein [uncultured Duganella sp.]
MTPAYLQRLDLDQQADERAIRRAYARELKQIDQEADPAAFQALREAYEEALAWLRWQQDDAAGAAPPGAPTASPDAAAASAHPSEPPGEPAPSPHAESAASAFDTFMRHTKADLPHAALNTSAFWHGQLERSLDGLIDIEARQLFEHRIATLLTQGWQPGHEMLLVAAADIFSWKEDRRRLYQLGLAGAIVDRALEEHAMFSLQQETARWQQSQLIARLRNPQPPGAGELIRNNARLEWLQANYSTWLAIITNADAIARWQQAYADLPQWRRKLSPGNWGKNSSSPYELQSGFSWKWLWVLLIVGLIRMCSSVGNDQPKPPPQQQQQQSARQTMRSGDYLRKGNAHLERNEYQDAIDNYDRVIEMTPNNFMAYIGRGTAYLSLGDDQQAEADFTESARHESDNHALHTARGKLADYRQQPAEAIEHYSDALAMLPQGDRQLYWLRSQAYSELGDYTRALADVNQLIDGASGVPSLFYTYRMELLLKLGRVAQADAAVNSMLAMFPTESDVYRVISEQYRKHGQTQKADSMLERGIKAAPDASLLLGRARLRAASDLPGRRADLVRASKMAPDSFLVTQERIDLEIAAGNPAAAEDIAAQAISHAAKEDRYRPALIAMRGVVAAKRGDQSAAEQYFSDALKASDKPWQMNEICWLMTVRNVSLPTALFICDAALERRPDYKAALDSRGLVLLRLGRNQEALDAYQAVQASKTNYVHSLMGRGIARKRLGDHAGGDADIKAALEAEPSLGRIYAGYGIRL